MKIRLKGKFETRQVWADDKELHPRQSFKLRVHSPDGFSWGYCGSGPAQLAMAVLLKYYTKDYVWPNYQSFKEQVIAVLPLSDFEAIVTINDRLKTATYNIEIVNQNNI